MSKRPRFASHLTDVKNNWEIRNWRNMLISDSSHTDHLAPTKDTSTMTRTYITTAWPTHSFHFVIHRMFSLRIVQHRKLPFSHLVRRPWCFLQFPKKRLCGSQCICSCLKLWYFINAQGHVVDKAAVSTWTLHVYCSHSIESRPEMSEHCILCYAYYEKNSTNGYY